ncbi:S-methyl-5-thioribose kinase [Paenibacillus albiflavus]|uniref:S-methyl-5-thioribose kinase n=1 Tax=Paenibacillus albiflavus TaxID=2545760 RepID=A0A4R4EK57_9BACL|nr:S-methyl-5-thioribose kinase [Paenibacillus albiflavus]TCZ78771.1 S-methyl-5-thioribose kinase [Paenibacillus albiflavus]
MKDFSAYFTMKETDAIAYATTQLDMFDHNAELTCTEIGDGNLNFVFRIQDKKTGKSIILKQAGPVARISSDIAVSPDRNRIESEILAIQYKLAPGSVPQIYKFDSVMNCCVMEDLSDHVIMRKALMEHKQFPLFADHITTFLASTLLLTSDVVMNHKEKKDLVKSFINQDLCEISEDLVYTEPFYDCPRNEVFELTRAFAKQHLWDDEALLLETAKLKFEFMTNAQSLIHGDLHTGSIFVKEDSTKIFDPEFAFYGPAGYDIGNVIANLIFAYINAEMTMDAGPAKETHTSWLLETIGSIIDLFQDKWNKLWDEKATDRVAQYKGFKSFYLSNVLKDTAAVAGLEMIRRTLGLAHVKDVTSIADDAKRSQAEKFCLIVGKRFIMEREQLTTGAKYLEILKAGVQHD